MEKQTNYNPDTLPNSENDFLRPGQNKIYVKKARTLEDVRSTASTFTLLGLLGIVFFILLWNDIIYLPMESYAKLIFSIVMGALFLFFLLVGIHACFQIRSLKEATAAEESQTHAIIEWFVHTYTAEEIDQTCGISSEHLDEESSFFPRSERIKALIGAQYANLSDAYLDELIEEIYEKIF